MNETSLTGTGYPYRYRGYDSRVMNILTDTAYSLYRVDTAESGCIEQPRETEIGGSLLINANKIKGE